MLNPEAIAKIGRQIYDLLPTPLTEGQQEVEKNIRAVLQGAFAKLDLVNREEFDAQVAVLKRTRAKLEALERELEQLQQPASTPAQTKDPETE